MDRVREDVGPARALEVRALGVLFDQPGRPDAAAAGLERAVGERGAGKAALRGSRSLGSGASGLVDKDVSVKAGALLDIDIGGVLATGWTRYAALREAGRRSLADPGTDEVVPLHAHRITSVHEPRVELLLDGRPVHSFDFRLEVALEVEGVSALVRAGWLVAVRGGACTGDLALFLADELLARTKRTWDPALIVDLRRPISLVAAAATRPA